MMVCGGVYREGENLDFELTGQLWHKEYGAMLCFRNRLIILTNHRFKAVHQCSKLLCSQCTIGIQTPHAPIKCFDIFKTYQFRQHLCIILHTFPLQHRIECMRRLTGFYLICQVIHPCPIYLNSTYCSCQIIV